MSDDRTNVRRFGCSPAVLSLSVVTCLVLLCMLPNALWFPMGLFYAGFAHGLRPSQTFLDRLSLVVYPVLGLLALINLAWMIHAVRSWRTSRQAVDAEQPASIPEGATEPFMKQPLPSPDRVRPEETESH